MDDLNRDSPSESQSAEAFAPDPRTTLSVTARRAFFDQVTRQTRSLVGAEWTDLLTRPQSYLLKVHFENERVHYEVALHASLDLIEVGLHFEDGPISSTAYLHFFDQRIVELKHTLGAELELERWTASWGRLYYMIPLLPLDAAKATQAASLLSGLITTLQPLVTEANVAPERAAEPRSGPWRTWRRSRG